MKYKDSTLNSFRADILADTKKFLHCLNEGGSIEELSAILAQIKEKETKLIKEEGLMIAPDLWKLLHNRLASRIGRDVPDDVTKPIPDQVKFLGAGVFKHRF
jgi:hypothetical protein